MKTQPPGPPPSQPAEPSAHQPSTQGPPLPRRARPYSMVNNLLRPQRSRDPSPHAPAALPRGPPVARGETQYRPNNQVAPTARSKPGYETTFVPRSVVNPVRQSRPKETYGLQIAPAHRVELHRPQTNLSRHQTAPGLNNLPASPAGSGPGQGPSSALKAPAATSPQEDLTVVSGHLSGGPRTVKSGVALPWMKHSATEPSGSQPHPSLPQKAAGRQQTALVSPHAAQPGVSTVGNVTMGYPSGPALAGTWYSDPLPTRSSCTADAEAYTQVVYPPRPVAAITTLPQRSSQPTDPASTPSVACAPLTSAILSSSAQGLQIPDYCSNPGLLTRDNFQQPGPLASSVEPCPRDSSSVQRTPVPPGPRPQVPAGKPAMATKPEVEASNLGSVRSPGCSTGIVRPVPPQRLSSLPSKPSTDTQPGLPAGATSDDLPSPAYTPSSAAVQSPAAPELPPPDATPAHAARHCTSTPAATSASERPSVASLQQFFSSMSVPPVLHAGQREAGDGQELSPGMASYEFIPIQSADSAHTKPSRDKPLPDLPPVIPQDGAATADNKHTADKHDPSPAVPSLPPPRTPSSGDISGRPLPPLPSPTSKPGVAAAKSESSSPATGDKSLTHLGLSHNYASTVPLPQASSQTGRMDVSRSSSSGSVTVPSAKVFLMDKYFEEMERTWHCTDQIRGKNFFRLLFSRWD